MIIDIVYTSKYTSRSCTSLALFLQGSLPSWSLHGLCFYNGPITLLLVQTLTHRMQKVFFRYCLPKFYTSFTWKFAVTVMVKI